MKTWLIEFRKFGVQYSITVRGSYVGALAQVIREFGVDGVSRMTVREVQNA